MSTPQRQVAQRSSAPATPVTPASAPSTPQQPGTWRHPRFDEIARRQHATTFSDQNLRKILYNASSLLGLFIVEQLTRTNFPGIYPVIAPLRPYSVYAYNLFRVILAYNILVALLPLIKPKDELSDIPLTPAQRKLLGLPATATPPTAGTSYSTPPRYPRSSTPLSNSPGSPSSGSPLAGRGSGGNRTPIKGSPYSPNASPMVQKLNDRGLNSIRRGSYGSPSPLGPGAQKAWMDAPSTPSPSTGKGASVGLNSRWLYERGRTSSGNSSMFS